MIIKDIQLQNGELSENLEKIKSINNQIAKRKVEDVIEGKLPLIEIVNFSFEDLLELGIEPETVVKLCLEIDRYKKTDEYLMNIEISEEFFSYQTVHLLRCSGIFSLVDLKYMSPAELLKCRNIGKKCVEEIVTKAKEYSIPIKPDKEFIYEPGDRTEYKSNLKLGLSYPTVCILMHARINSLADLANITEEQLMGVRNLRKENYDEIIEAMRKHGISFKETKEKEMAKKQELVQRILKKQRIIEEQQNEIDSLRKNSGTKQQ